MSEPKSKIKIPNKNGLEEARKKLKNMRRREPSPELIKIIDEVTKDKPDGERDIAARPHSSEAEA